ncbi:MAG: MBL fold metallo-hydrolase RNA specificity domain-containing protein [bacterium]
MKIQFWGGVGTVTGSQFILKSDGKQLLLECGLFQGHREEAEEINRHLPYNAREIDWCAVSHAHIDHIGNLPNLIKNGFKGSVLMTKPSVALSRLLLLDSAKIQEGDIKYLNRKRRARHEPPKEPIYTIADVEHSLPRLKGIGYARLEKLGPFSIHFHDAGHVLGSALIDIAAEGKRVLFTGDLGRKKMPIIRDPVQVDQVDILIMEATYGNRLHTDYHSVQSRLAGIVNRVASRQGRIIIPAFAVERAQEIVYNFRKLRLVDAIPDIPIFVDSPLASRVTEVYRNSAAYFDQEAQKLVADEPNSPFDFPGLYYIDDVAESKKLNSLQKPCIIISPSGMCEAGRVLHHLRHSVTDPKNLILIVSFQAEHTLGRRLMERPPVVRIFGEEFPVRAEVEVMNEFSAHADRNGLLDYVHNMRLDRLKKVFLVHSEPMASAALVDPLKNLGVAEVILPHKGEEYEI